MLAVAARTSAEAVARTSAAPAAPWDLVPTRSAAASSSADMNIVARIDMATTGRTVTHTAAHAGLASGHLTAGAASTSAAMSAHTTGTGTAMSVRTIDTATIGHTTDHGTADTDTRTAVAEREQQTTPTGSPACCAGEPIARAGSRSPITAGLSHRPAAEALL